MTRPLRLSYPGALYHITSRGNARQDIFYDNQDRRSFLKSLAEAVKTYGWRCHAYCLMNNHYHLLIETPEANLSLGMRDLNGGYTQKFNRRYDRPGHIFQGRFHSSLIEDTSYLLAAARYIVLNPVRAGMVRDPADWKWSSYRVTAGKDRVPSFLTKNKVLSALSMHPLRARMEYVNFVWAGIGMASPFEEKKAVAGSARAVHDVWSRFEDRSGDEGLSYEDRMLGRPSLEDLFFDISSMSERNAAIYLARYRCGYSVVAIARFLSCHQSTVGKIARRMGRVMQDVSF